MCGLNNQKIKISRYQRSILLFLPTNIKGQWLQLSIQLTDPNGLIFALETKFRPFLTYTKKKLKFQRTIASFQRFGIILVNYSRTVNQVRG